MKIIAPVGVLALALVACSSSSQDDRVAQTVPTAAPTSTTTQASSQYTIRFQDFMVTPNANGLGVGERLNLVVAFDLGSHNQVYKKPEGFYEGLITPKIATSKDLTSFCVNVAEDFHKELGFVDVAPGDATSIESIDATLATSFIDQNGQAYDSDDNEMCFGYRKQGKWYWNTLMQKGEWDKTTQRYQIRFTIQQDSVDAFKMLFNQGNKRILEKLVLNTKK